MCSLKEDSAGIAAIARQKTVAPAPLWNRHNKGKQPLSGNTLRGERAPPMGNGILGSVLTYEGEKRDSNTYPINPILQHFRYKVKVFIRF